MREIKDLTNMTFNRLTAKKRVGVNKQKHSLWECECICGNKTIVNASTLEKGTTKSCGCLNRERTIERNKRKAKENRVGDINRTFYGATRAKAFHRKHNFEVSIEYIWDLFLKQNKKCALSGVDLYFNEGTTKDYWNYTNASLDRIDSSKDYIEGNVQWVHKKINPMKLDNSQEEFINLCHLVAKTHPMR